MFIGIDIGTQSLKAIVVDEKLNQRGSASVGYQPVFPRPGEAEQDSGLWLSALRPAIAGALESAGVQANSIASMAVCGQLDGCIPTDRDGAALGNALIWMDRRGEPFLRQLDRQTVRQTTGLVLDGTHMAAKIAWHQRHFDRIALVATWHQPVSFVLAALTGVTAIDPGLASTTMLLNLQTQHWDDGIMETLSIDRSKLPLIAPAASIAAGLSSGGAALTGLNKGTLVAVGTGDDFSSPLGSGLCRPGIVGISLGTAEVISALAKESVIDHQGLVETHLYPTGHYHLGNPGWLSGGAVRWFMSAFSVQSAAEVSGLAASVAPGSDGLLFLPALTGAMAPEWIAAARGAYYGITPTHTKAHFARALLEGCAYAMRDVIDRLTALDVDTSVLRIVGGGAESAVWTSIRTDLTGRPADSLTGGDASAMGAGLIAATAAGAYPSLAIASAALELGLTRREPNPGLRGAYEDAYGRYRLLFDALRPIFAAARTIS